MNSESLWQCPLCGRRFARKNQSHSCIVHPVANHFLGKPARLRQTFERLLAKTRRLGPVRVDAVKSAINLSGKNHFAMVYVLKASLKMDFALYGIPRSGRILRTEKLGGNRYLHYVRLTRLEDVDDELLGWLEEAYFLAQAEPLPGRIR